uniref:PlsC domain-containing protein n=1 Tax=Haemonchus contortus TaxID=6289 RepID=A0A7I5EEW6_HAECO
MVAWLFLMFFPPVTITVLLVIVVASFGGTLGIRELFVEGLTRIFEWGAQTTHGYEYLEDENESGTSGESPPFRIKKRHSSGDLGIIHREKSDLVDSKLHSTDEPECRQTTVSVVVDDSIDFIAAGIEAIIEDQVTSRFRAEQLPSWNLLTRTRYSFQYINWKLSLLWAAGFLFRYLVLVPIRILLFILGLTTMCGVCYIVGHVPNQRIRKFLNRHVMLMSMRIFSRSFSSIIRFHDQENRAKKGGICVANHTSPIDVMVLSCDNCYAMIGQKQGGLLGFIQDSLSRAEHHIWFERSEAADRKKVVQRLREHVEDENKLPIIIFPEGTCINNTSVMMFKKGSFEIGSTIYPIAMKYDSRLTDAFWNSSEQSYGEYLWRMMTSWAIICDVWYLPPMTKEEGEDAIAFARRVKRAIAKKGGLVDLEWDGALKRERVSSKLIQLQQKLYYDRLTRTTTINNITEEDLQTDVLDIMQSISEEDRNSLMKQLDETDDDDAIIRKVSAYRHDLRKLSDSMGAAVEPDSKHV